MTRDSVPPIIAVGGGKGGVGKSVVAANLAVAMGRLGFRTVVFDADLGAANQHTLFGIDHPKRTVQSFFDGEVQSLEECVEATGIDRVHLVPGTGAVSGAANIPFARKQKLIRHIRRLDAEAIIIDCGAGSSFNVVDFFNIADVRLVVASPQLTSLQNAYAFVKSAVFRAFGVHAENARKKELLATAIGSSETDRVRDVVERVANEDSELALELARAAATYEALIVANQVEFDGQANVLYALSRMMGDFLSVDAAVACTLPISPRIHSSVTRRVPFVLRHPASPEARALDRLAESILVRDFDALRRSRISLPEESDFSPDEGLSVPPLGRYLRRHHRYRVSLHAKVETRGGTAAAKIIDVSRSGVALSGAISAQVGETVQVRVPPDERPFTAIVRSVVGNRVSVEVSGDDAEQRGAQLVELARRQSAA